MKLKAKSYLYLCLFGIAAWLPAAIVKFLWDNVPSVTIVFPLSGIYLRIMTSVIIATLQIFSYIIGIGYAVHFMMKHKKIKTLIEEYDKFLKD